MLAVAQCAMDSETMGLHGAGACESGKVALSFPPANEKRLPSGAFFVLLAERVRFELTVRLNVRQISSLVHSTTLPPFLIRSFPRISERAALYQAEAMWQG
jgi:hypothetical protein